MQPKIIQIASYDQDLYGLAENGAVYRLTTEDKYSGRRGELKIEETRQKWELVTGPDMVGEWKSNA